MRIRSGSLKAFWLVRLLRTCFRISSWFYAFESLHRLGTALESCKEMHLKTCSAMQLCHLQRAFGLMQGTVGRSVGFCFAYRSHARVGHRVSTGVCGLCFASCFWISLLSAASCWTVDSRCYLTSLVGFPERRSHCNARNQTLVLSAECRYGRTRFGHWRLTNQIGRKLWDLSCSGRSAL